MYNIRNPSKCIQKCLQYIFLKKLQFSERWTSHQANSDTTLKHNITLQSFTQVFGENNLKTPNKHLFIYTVYVPKTFQLVVFKTKWIGPPKNRTISSLFSKGFLYKNKSSYTSVPIGSSSYI